MSDLPWLDILAVWVGASILTAPFIGAFLRDARHRMEADRRVQIAQEDADFAATTDTTDTPTFALVSLERHRAEVERRGQR